MKLVVSQTGCRTEVGCTCKQTWNYQGSEVKECGNPDSDVYGSWCVIEEQNDGNGICSPKWKVKESGEYWDRCYCSPKTNIKGGCVTGGGCVCADSWQYKGISMSECGNPDGDIIGAWCVVDESLSESCIPLGAVNSTGEPWDRCYCADAHSSYSIEESATVYDVARSASQTQVQAPAAPVVDECMSAEAIWCDIEFLRKFKMNMPLVAQYELGSWVDGTKALAATNPCSETQPWTGITCSYVQDNHRRVTKISLGMYDWTLQYSKWVPNWASYRAIPSSQLPSDLSKVAYLEELELAYTFIDASLPQQISALKHLKVLDFSGNSVQENNGVRGTLPEEYSVLTDLRVFYAFQNKLTGTIPMQYSTLVKLDQFRVSSNNLIGSVPPQLSTIRGELWFGGSGGGQSEGSNDLCVGDEYTSGLISSSASSTDIVSLPYC